MRIDKVELKPASIVFYQSIHRSLPENEPADKSKSTNTLLSSTKIVIACVQNQIKPDPSPQSSPQPSDQPVNQESVAPMAVDNGPIIRPIRVPQNYMI